MMVFEHAPKTATGLTLDSLGLDTPAIAASPAATLRQPAPSWKPQPEQIIGALDTHFGSY